MWGKKKISQRFWPNTHTVLPIVVVVCFRHGHTRTHTHTAATMTHTYNVYSHIAIFISIHFIYLCNILCAHSFFARSVVVGVPDCSINLLSLLVRAPRGLRTIQPIQAILVGGVLARLFAIRLGSVPLSICWIHVYLYLVLYAHKIRAINPIRLNLYDCFDTVTVRLCVLCSVFC